MGVPLALNHIGVTVPDVFAAIDWYQDVFGMRLLMPPRVLEGSVHREAGSALGPRFRTAWQAHLLTGNGAGVEVFQFLDPEPDFASGTGENVPFTRLGTWHVCLTHPDPGLVMERGQARGGTVLSEPAVFVPGRPWMLAYIADPWGLVWEVMSASYAEVFANWPQPGQTTPAEYAVRPELTHPAPASPASGSDHEGAHE
ncbi:MAG: VOC family protein [Microbacteriaceae bacterium]|uniref:VOC family protein n=1 Tax=Microbacterium sp. TaxID=51671 RepID=UPI003F9A6BF3